ncbi:MAG: hypothetical protein E7218_07335 [Anaerofustis stercorihominis]|nr:hypothetical protein [Anaerofustis stercorihominis]
MKGKLTKSGVFLAAYAITGILLFGGIYLFSPDSAVLDIASKTYISSAAAALAISDIIDGNRQWLRVCSLLTVFGIVVYICLEVL